MNNLKLLTSLEIKRQLASYSKKGKMLEIFLYILLLLSSFSIGMIVSTMLFSAHIMDNPKLEDAGFKELLYTGIGNQIIDIQATLLFILCFATGFIMMKLIFFNKFDQNTLWSLPLTKKEILISKFLGMMIPYLLPILLFSLSSIIISYVMYGSILRLLLLTLSYYLVAIFGFNLSMLFRLFLLKILPVKEMPKWAGAIIKVFFMALFFGIYFYQVSRQFRDIFLLYEKYLFKYQIFRIISSSIAGHYLMFFILTISSLSSFFFLFYLLDKYYFDFTSNHSSNKTIQEIQNKDYRVRTSFLSLVRKEISLYWNNPAVVTNSFITVFFLLFFAGASLVPSLRDVFLKNFSHIGNFNKDTILFFLFIFLGGTINISTYSFSIEAKMAYNTYVLPLSGQKIFLAKLSASLIQILPFFLVSFLIFVLSLTPSLKYTPLLLIAPLAYIFLNNAIGLFFDLKFANYTWDDPKQLAKQSKQAFFTSFGNLIFSAILFLLGYGMLAFYPYISCLLITLLLVIVDFLFILLIKNTKIYHQ